MPRFPKLRTDLVLKTHSTPEGREVIAKDPVTGRFFRMREVEAFVAQRLDGKTDPADIRHRAEETFSGVLPEEVLTRFLATLEREGLLRGAKASRASQSARWRGSLFYLRYRLFDPDRWLESLEPRTRWIYSTRSLVFASLLIVWAITISASQWETLAEEVAGLYRLQTLPFLLVATFLIISAHEFAHGLTCKRFGGEVREIGFILIYFQPAMYCNVSDAWLFPEKSKRLFVGLAGPAFEIFLWSLATVLWHLAEPDTLIHRSALLVMAISGLKTLVNFNPLIKLDGYYLLSDYLEIPNLRRRSARYLGDRLRGFFLGEPPIERLPTSRERRIFLAYGAVSTFASFAFAGFALFVTGSYFLETHQPLGLLAFTGLLGAVSQRRFRRLFGGADEEDETSPDSAEPTESGGQTAPTQGSFRRNAWKVAAVVALLLTFVVRLELRVGGAFDVVPLGKTEVRAVVEGVVESVLVQEGATVAAGNPVARLSGTELEAKAAVLEAQIRETQSQLALLEAGPLAEEIEVSKVAVASARDRLDYARRRHDMDSQLLSSGLVSRKAFEESEAVVAQGESDLATAKARLQQLQRGSRTEEIEAARARLDRLLAEASFVERDRERLAILSPVTGIVATSNRDLLALPGRLVTKGGLVAEIYAPASLTASIVVPEKEIADVEVGQPVILRARAFPSEKFQGTVRSIGVVASGNSSSAGAPLASGANPVQSSTRMFVVTASIEDSGHGLQPEMSGQAKILCGPRSVASLILRRLIRTFKIEVWSWW